MLRIKEGIDLKELEKYGYEYYEDDGLLGTGTCYLYEGRCKRIYTSKWVQVETRKCEANFDGRNLRGEELEDEFDDLIKADMVEKGGGINNGYRSR